MFPYAWDFITIVTSISSAYRLSQLFDGLCNIKCEIFFHCQMNLLQSPNVTSLTVHIFYGTGHKKSFFLLFFFSFAIEIFFKPNVDIVQC